MWLMDNPENTFFEEIIVNLKDSRDEPSKKLKKELIQEVINTLLDTYTLGNDEYFIESGSSGELIDRAVVCIRQFQEDPHEGLLYASLLYLQEALRTLERGK